MMEEGVFY